MLQYSERKQVVDQNPDKKSALQSMKLAVMPQVVCSQNGVHISLGHLEVRRFSS